MKFKIIFITSLLLILLVLLVAPGLKTTHAATRTPTYSMNWNVISSGGTSFTTNGKYTLGSTIGQSPAGRLSVTGKLLNVGFWLQGLYGNFLPLLIR